MLFWKHRIGGFMEFINKSFKIVTALSPIIIMLVSIFQWKSTDKQNDQNLFKMRLECYNKFNSLTTNIGENLFRIKQLHKIPENLQEVQLQGKELLLMAAEIQLLYGENIAQMYANFVHFIFENLKAIKKVCDDDIFLEEEKAEKVPKLASDVASEMCKQIEFLAENFKQKIKF